jgi:hypothetical protein
MDKRARLLLLPFLFLLCCLPGHAADARFDLIGPKIDVRVTRNGQTLPIAAVPNLQPGDRLWLHPDLPSTQSVKYLLICAFLRGNTNPPPENWFFRIETWDPKVREEGTFVTVPSEAQQAVLFLAPETGGDFSTLRSAVRGRPGAFVRASQDLLEAGFEEARIEKYIASIRRVPPSDPAELQKHSNLLARTLALKPNEACFKQPVDTQFTCLTQTGSQIVLDDGNGQTIANALNGPTSDLIAQASYTAAAGGGVYSAYVGAVVDVVRIMSGLHTAKYQYIPAISFPQAEAMNLRLNTPPSFHNPKSVLVIALPAVQAAVTPPLRPADTNEVTCLIKPSVVLPIEGAPLVFSTDFAHDLVLHLNIPPGAPPEPDIPLQPDAYFGGLILQKDQQHHIPLRDPILLQTASADTVEPTPFADPRLAPKTPAHPAKPQHEPGVPGQLAGRGGEPGVPGQLAGGGGEPVLLTGVIKGRWGFDAFTGPTVKLQQLPGSGWIIIPNSGSAKDATSGLIAGHTAELLLTSTGSACVHTITAHPNGYTGEITIPFKPDPKPSQPELIALTLPLDHDLTPGDLHLAIQQYDQPKADEVSARTFSEPAKVSSIEIHAGDKTLVLNGTRLGEIDKLTLGDLVFSPAPDASDDIQPVNASSPATLHFALPANAPAPPTHVNDHLTANISLHDGRSLSLPVIVSSARPIITMLSKSVTPSSSSDIILSNPNDLPLTSLLTFTLKSPNPFPRNGQIEIETLDGTLRTVLTLAPSGGLLLQDPHTVVATLDPLRSFGPSAFGALRLRAIYPVVDRHHNAHNSQAEATTQPEATVQPNDPANNSAADDDLTSPASDWLPLVTLVRLPTLSQLQCPADATQPCTVTGSDFFLLQGISTDPSFSDPVPVPDGYTGTSLTMPHPEAATIFFKLRDDPASIDSALLSVPAPILSRAHGSGHIAPAKQQVSAPAIQQLPNPATQQTLSPAIQQAPVPAAQQTPTSAAQQTPAPATQDNPAPTKQKSPAPIAPSSPATPSPSGI